LCVRPDEPGVRGSQRAPVHVGRGRAIPRRRGRCALGAGAGRALAVARRKRAVPRRGSGGARRVPPYRAAGDGERIPMIFLLVALFAACPVVASAQERGSLEGHVLDGRTQQPLANAVLSVVGGHLQARTDDAGFFRLAPLAPGPLNVRIQRPGYAAAIEPVDVVEADKVEFQLFSAATVLDALVVQARASEVTSFRDGA